MMKTMMKTMRKMINMCCNTISTNNTTFLFWKCSDCKYVEESVCSECGNKKFRCTKMGVVVKSDFFCKDWESKHIIRYNPDYIIPDEFLVDPHIPVQPTEDDHPCLNGYIPSITTSDGFRNVVLRYTVE